MSTVRKKASTASEATGKVVSTVPGFVLVEDRSSNRAMPRTAVSERASTLLPKIALALGQPGISRDAVFKGQRRHVYSYSVDTTDTDRVIRVDADGRRTVGRLVGARFVASKA